MLIWMCRAFLILSMTLSLNLAIRESRTPSPRMGFMRRHITEPFQIVFAALQIGSEDTDGFTAADPACPQAIMQWQHGTVIMNSDLSLSLTPFAVDGRQLQSDPCASNTATYTRYNQSETFEVHRIRSYPL